MRIRSKNLISKCSIAFIFNLFSSVLNVTRSEAWSTYLIIGSVGKIYAIIIGIGHGMLDCYDHILTSQPAMAVRAPPTLCMAKDDRPCFMLSSCSQVSAAGSYLQQGVSAAVLQCLHCPQWRGLQSARSNTAAQF